MRSSWRVCARATGSLAALACCSLLGACSQNSTGVPSPGRGAEARPATSSWPYIQHVVILVQENRSFDDFFATFPGADGTTVGLMKTSGGDIEVPLKEAGLVSDSLGHQHHAFQLEYDHGKMDGFGLVDRVLRKGRKVKAGLYTYRYVSPTDIQPYWQIAQQYVLGDHMFTTQSSSSFTAHQDLVAA